MQSNEFDLCESKGVWLGKCMGKELEQLTLKIW